MLLAFRLKVTVGLQIELELYNPAGLIVENTKQVLCGSLVVFKGVKLSTPSWKENVVGVTTVLVELAASGAAKVLFLGRSRWW